MVRPKKNLGQHFLTDPSIAERITQALEARDIQTVIEVGPGKGILTRFLIERKEFSLFPVEIDPEAIAYLQEVFPELEENLISGDFLKLDMKKYRSPVGIIGNFPYNISSQILFKVLDNRDIVDELVGMFQREVADRIISPPGSKRYGILSVFLQAWYTITNCFNVNPGSFFPPPKVKSSVIRMVRNERKSLGCDYDLFFRIVKMAFNQRRKVLANSLSSYMNGSHKDEPILRRRPEELGVEEFVELVNLIEGWNPNLLQG